MTATGDGDMPDGSSSYSDSGFWDKCRHGARGAGRQVLEKALWLYYALQNDACPAWAKATIIGALGYFILPVDAIPDLIPGAGYTDDLGVLAGAVVAVASQIDGAVKKEATKTLKSWRMA